MVALGSERIKSRVHSEIVEARIIEIQKRRVCARAHTRTYEYALHFQTLYSLVLYLR